MNLSIATYWPKTMPSHLAGMPTDFKLKIWESFLVYGTRINLNEFVGHSHLDFLKHYEFGSIKEKCHTIRADKNNRWKAGTPIHFFEWTGKPYRSPQFKFAPLINCSSVQSIEICWTDADGFKMHEPTIWVDGTWLVGKQKEALAINDGFDGLDSFYAWFDKDFKGVIIHWTNLKYV